MSEKRLKLLEIVKDVMERTSNLSCTFKERIELLNDATYNSIFKPIQFLQKDSLVLFRYGNYSDVFSGETEFGASYTQFWDMYDGIYRTMRSIVIDIDTLEVVTYPFDKFFNLNEMEETNINTIREYIKKAKSIEISDKLDGSMACVRYYNNEVFATGSKSIIREQSWRLNDIYNMIESNPNIMQMIMDYSNYTFIFESITKSDVHVVIYDDKDLGLHLIGARNMDTFEMLSYKDIVELANKYNILTTTIFDKTFDEVINSLDDKKSNEKEGFVLNIDGFYVKIKYNDYVLMHGILSNISSINLVIRNYADETLDDLLSKIPTAYRNRVMVVVNLLNKYVQQMESRIIFWYDKVKDMNIKDAAIFLSNECDKKIFGYVLAKYKGKPYNVLKKGTSGYKKLIDMGYDPSQYYSLFEIEE